DFDRRRRNSCDTNDENDNGRIVANYWDYSYRCQNYIGGRITYWLRDMTTGLWIVDRVTMSDNTQEMHDLAMACAAVLNELAAEQNLVNECSDQTRSKQLTEQDNNLAYDLSENPEKFMEMLEAELDGDLPEELEDIFNPEK
ncbi:MAG: hypothetical protein KJO29_09885, partial [Bacteroidia bacterium]|nr:hypothetical protein [Bacteroidia bacterium]